MKHKTIDTWHVLCHLAMDLFKAGIINIIVLKQVIGWEAENMWLAYDYSVHLFMAKVKLNQWHLNHAAVIQNYVLPILRERERESNKGSGPNPTVCIAISCCHLDLGDPFMVLWMHLAAG